MGLVPVPGQNVEHVNQRPAVRQEANRRRAQVEQEPVNGEIALNVQMEAKRNVDSSPPQQMRMG